MSDHKYGYEFISDFIVSQLASMVKFTINFRYSFNSLMRTTYGLKKYCSLILGNRTMEHGGVMFHGLRSNSYSGIEFNLVYLPPETLLRHPVIV